MIPFADNVLNSYLSIAPEIGLLVLIIIVLAYERFTGPEQRRSVGLLTAWGTLIVFIGTVVIMMVEIGSGEAGFAAGTGVGAGYAEPLVWGGMLRHDLLSFVFRLIFIAATFITALVATDVKKLQRMEYFGLLLMVNIGLNLMAASTDLVMLYVSLETVSICLYVLAGFLVTSNRSVEAGMKYFIYGSFASALMLFGFSWLYGLMAIASKPGVVFAETNALSGTLSTNYMHIGRVVTAMVDSGLFTGMWQLAFLGAAVLVIIGFGFKISIVPFHFWTPDVYEGAPTATTAYLSTASKAAGFAVFIRIFALGAFGAADANASNLWWILLAAMCIVTMVVGNFLAIFQRNIKRMLAYSSIAQAGYVMIGLVIFTAEGAGAAIYYLALYVVTNIAAFGVIILISNVTNADNMEDLYGLNKRSPYMALVMMFALLSLGGIPPTAGFFGKFFIFNAAVEAGLWWLALIGILNAFVALYYYLNVIKYMYLYDADEELASKPIPVSRAAAIALGVSFAGILLLGILPEAVYDLTQLAALQFFPFP